MSTICAPWEVDFPCDVDCLSPTVTGLAVQFASEVVWALSGRQFGLCPVTIRPCRRDCYNFPLYGWHEYSWPMPALIGGQWFNLVCGICDDTCSCTVLSEVVLPNVYSIEEILIDGSPLVTGAYRVDNFRYLVRTDGGSWPRCNDLSLPSTEIGTWEITAQFGTPVPASGALAVGELACELSKALNNEACRLPRNVTQLSRQGVTINYGDVTDLFANGLTGLYLTDLFIQTYNPHHIVQRARTFSIDRPQIRSTTWPVTP